MRAAIAGDICGSRFERSLWQGTTFSEAICIGYDVPKPRFDATGEKAETFELFHLDCYVTDDSILMLALIDWILHQGELKHYLRKHFLASSRPELFGKGFRGWASQNKNESCHSFGNGAAMRVAPIGYVSDDPVRVRELARESALVTHQVPDAVVGAEAIALGVLLARTGSSKEEIQQELLPLLGDRLLKPLDEIRPGYRFTSSSADTVPLACRAFLEAETYEETLRRAISVGGDSDTIACMAGALAGAFWGTPSSVRSHVSAYLGGEQLDLLMDFEAEYPAAKRTIF